MSAGGRPDQKLRLFDLLLQDGVATLHLDARRPGVIVPPHLRSDEWLVLNYSYRFHLADFTFDDKGVRASLSFQGQAFPCTVPWPAVFAITNKDRTEGRLWREDMPASVRGRLGVADAAASADTGDDDRRPGPRVKQGRKPPTPPASATKRPARDLLEGEPREAPQAAAARLGLRVLDGGQPGNAPRAPRTAPAQEPMPMRDSPPHRTDPAPDAPPPPKPGGHLRRVK